MSLLKNFLSPYVTTIEKFKYFINFLAVLLTGGFCLAAAIRQPLALIAPLLIFSQYFLNRNGLLPLWMIKAFDYAVLPLVTIGATLSKSTALNLVLAINLGLKSIPYLIDRFSDKKFRTLRGAMPVITKPFLETTINSHSLQEVLTSMPCAQPNCTKTPSDILNLRDSGQEYIQKYIQKSSLVPAHFPIIGKRVEMMAKLYDESCYSLTRTMIDMEAQSLGNTDKCFMAGAIFRTLTPTGIAEQYHLGSQPQPYLDDPFYTVNLDHVALPSCDNYPLITEEIKALSLEKTIHDYGSEHKERYKRRICGDPKFIDEHHSTLSDKDLLYFDLYNRGLLSAIENSRLSDTDRAKLARYYFLNHYKKNGDDDNVANYLETRQSLTSIPRSFIIHCSKVLFTIEPYCSEDFFATKYIAHRTSAIEDSVLLSSLLPAGEELALPTGFKEAWCKTLELERDATDDDVFLAYTKRKINLFYAGLNGRTGIFVELTPTQLQLLDNKSKKLMDGFREGWEKSSSAFSFLDTVLRTSEYCGQAFLGEVVREADRRYSRSNADSEKNTSSLPSKLNEILSKQRQLMQDIMIALQKDLLHFTDDANSIAKELVINNEIKNLQSSLLEEKNLERDQPLTFWQRMTFSFFAKKILTTEEITLKIQMLKASLKELILESKKDPSAIAHSDRHIYEPIEQLTTLFNLHGDRATLEVISYSHAQFGYAILKAATQFDTWYSPKAIADFLLSVGNHELHKPNNPENQLLPLFSEWIESFADEATRTLLTESRFAEGDDNSLLINPSFLMLFLVDLGVLNYTPSLSPSEPLAAANPDSSDACLTLASSKKALISTPTERKQQTPLKQKRPTIGY